MLSFSARNLNTHLTEKKCQPYYSVPDYIDKLNKKERKEF